MAEIPEHLLKRAAERRAALEAQKAGGGEAGGGAGGGGGASGSASASGEAAESGGGTAVATVERVSAGTGAATAPLPTAHTQRLLTVVKAGSIQDVKATPTDKVNVWPHLLVVEFAAALAMTAFLVVFSTFVNAPLQAAA